MGWIAYVLMLVLGYLLLPHFRRQASTIEALVLAFFLGSSNVVIVLLIAGIAQRLSYGVYALLLEVVALLVITHRRGFHSAEHVIVSVKPMDLFFVLLVAYGLLVRFYTIFTYLPAIAWDSLKLYLPWAKEMFLADSIPPFDLQFNLSLIHI